jgi:hypothetical protein
MALTRLRTGGITANAVVAAAIAPGAVDITDIADDAVTENKLAANAVIAAKIADNAITSVKISGTISTEKGGTGANTLALANIAVLNTFGTFSASQRGTVTTDNDGSFDMNATNNFLCTPTGAFTLTFTNITAGQSGNIILVNGSNYTIGQAATTKVAATTLATISATGTYWLAYFSPDGTNVYVANTAALA